MQKWIYYGSFSLGHWSAAHSPVTKQFLEISGQFICYLQAEDKTKTLESKMDWSQQWKEKSETPKFKDAQYL